MFVKIKTWINNKLNPIDPRFTRPQIDGYNNPFWDVEVIYKGESLLHESLSTVIHTRLKDYNLLNINGTPLILGINCNPEIILRLPTGSQVNIPLFVKNIDDKQYRQKGDGLPKA